jgi:hypothetical protein
MESILLAWLERSHNASTPLLQSPSATITVFALAQILSTFKEGAAGIGEQQE